MLFLHALGGIFGLLLVVAVGYVLAWKGWFSTECQMLLPRLVTYVALPPFLMSTFLQSFDRDNLLHMLYGALLPFTSQILTFSLAWVVGRAVGVRRRRLGLFCACVSNSNTIFVGIPVNLALFGEESLPYVLLYYFASTIFFWTVGNYAISSDGKSDGRERTRLGDNIRHIFSPPMLGFLTGLSLVLLNVDLPRFLLDTARHLGNLTTPLALLFIGISLQNMDLRHLRLDRDLTLALLGRLVLSPLVVALLVPLFPIPELMAKVFIMQASLPVLMQAAILSAYYRTDPEFGALMVSLSTLLSAITIPICMCLL
ncbi:AEC family transporter [uncultured Desulfovibrio sp.]|uniref:AEC family transporter n=1 Tax=uncultured Desulfovibrio sp. TaxID=167968 RepID=UPI00262105DD|nr:AEC family transporter [uncultured Desulfovibrio sp.]